MCRCVNRTRPRHLSFSRVRRKRTVGKFVMLCSSYTLSRNASSTFFTVSSSISSVRASEIKQDSNCDGGKYMPRSNRFQKKREKRAVSERLALLKSVTGSAEKYRQN